MVSNCRPCVGYPYVRIREDLRAYDVAKLFDPTIRKDDGEEVQREIFSTEKRFSVEANAVLAFSY